MPNYAVKNVKSFMGLDMPGYNATLYCDGKAVALVINDGGGGETDIQWKDYDSPRIDVPWKNSKGEAFNIRCTPLEAQLYEHIRGKTWKCEELNFEGDMDPETFVGQLVDQFEQEKTHKRWIKNQTVFRLKDQTEGEFRTLKMPFCKKAKDYIVNKYGDNVDYILNEKYGQQAL